MSVFRTPLLRLAGAVVALFLAACAPLDDDDAADELPQWQAIDVVATPAPLGAEHVGQLVFRGGVALDAEEWWFGGFSELEVLDGNRVLIVNDQARWFDGRLVLDESGALTGVADVRAAMMRDTRGHAYETRADTDSEGLAQLPDGRFAVSFEQTPRIMIYDFNRDGPFGAAINGPPLAETASLPANASLEALAATASGDLIVGAEGGGGPTPLWRVRIGDTTPAAPLAHYVLSDGYSLTSLDRLPDGDFVALERFYAPVVGARARIATFPAAALQQGAMIQPRRLAEIAPPLLVDNFEGVAAVRMPNGATRLYILSDDNFSERQRTLLLAFDVVE